MLTLRHRIGLGLTTLAFGFGTLTAHAPSARADEVSPTGKGIVGGALLGGDVVLIVGGIIGVKSPWYYVIGGGLGMIGGGIGGYFVEQAVTNPPNPATGGSGGDGHIPVYMLGGGLALIIPAIVLTLNATRYQPPSDTKTETAPKDLPAADPGKAGGSSVGGGTTTPTPAPTPAPDTTKPSSSLTPPPPPQSLVDVHQGAWRMGLPIPMIGAMYSVQTQKEQGVAAGMEVRMPLVHVTF